MITNHQHRKILFEWWHGARRTYNKTLFYMNELDHDNKNFFRNLSCNPENLCREKEVLKTPYAIRSYAAFQAYEMRSSAFTNLKNGNIKHFNVSYISKNKTKNNWSIRTDKRSITKKSERQFTIFPTFNNSLVFETQEDIGSIDGDITINYTNGNFYLIIPKKAKPVPFTSYLKSKVLSIDPGIKTFCTTYSSNGDSFKIGKGANDILYKKLLTLDGMISFTNKLKKRKQTKKRKQKIKIIEKRIIKLRNKLQNLQKELHNKTADFLCNQAEVILLPEFKVSKMIGKKRRKLRTKTVRHFQVLSHAKFREKLISKAEERRVNVILVSEHYTSKTCGYCGWIDKDLGSRNTFKCASCKNKIDRDLNGARNIMLRAMRDISIPDKVCYFLQNINR
jgi:putative transposase